MFIVAWEGCPPPDKADWIRLLREVLAAELGSYRVVFREHAGGWRFSLEWRDDEEAAREALIANSPESVAYNIYANLVGAGIPLDVSWKPRASRTGNEIRAGGSGD
ncbi:MAG TPA: hypothetical protein VL691_09590 [Vicinamibacteria bacterium]|nr:hypothetical protein [Vicinamibacteria bacterium]